MNEKNSFDENLKELQKLVTQLELSENSLEESMKIYKEASKLAKNCYNILENAKQEIEIINIADDMKRDE